MNAAQWLVLTLKKRGVECLYVLCGNGLDPLLDACLDAQLRVTDVRNEQAAAYMADTWGRMTGRLGVAAVSAGPGHTNALTGLANAFWDGGPMLLISGCSPLSTRGADHFQELDQVGMAAPVCKYAALVQHIAALPQQVETALACAVSGRPGPVHLTIPSDVLLTELDASAPLRDNLALCQVTPRCAGDAQLIREAVDLLATAQRPFLVVGSGAYYAQAWQPLAEFAQRLNIPVVSHIWDRGCIEAPLPQYMGVTNDELNRAMASFAEADLILTLGARIDYRLWHGRAPGFPQDARLIRVDIEPSEIARTMTPDVGIVGDPASVLRQLTAEVRTRPPWSYDGWLAQVRASRNSLLQHWAPLGHQPAWPLPAIRICREIKPFLDQDVTFLLDGGNIGRWAHMTLFDRHPAHWHTCGASGVVGWGLSGAIAAKMARPQHPLLLLSGDGAAGFNVTEIETALRFGTPYVAVIASDGAWGIVADGQKEGRRVACELGEIRFDRVAEALGAKGVYIERPEQLGPSIAWGLQQDTVVVIHVPTQMAGIGCWEGRYGPACGAGGPQGA
jgi:acetolactate synthase-1/2/3 large subunit